MIKRIAVVLFSIFSGSIWPLMLLAHEEHEVDRSTKSVVRNLSVPPSAFVELNLNFQGGKKILINFESDTLLEWNIHSHVGGQSIKHKRGRDKAKSVAFVAPLDGIFSFLWKNQTEVKAKLRVEFATQKGVEVHSWHPKEISN